MNGNIRVGNLFGIPFYINASWFLVLGLVTLTYGGELARFPQLAGGLPWLLGLVTALLLFASVLAHELGHSLISIRQGVNVKSITLFIFGGLAALEEESKTPGEAFRVAIAGPAVSLFLFGVLTAINLNLNLPAPAQAVLGLLAQINFFLAAFNLIPGLPLDGGNVLKSIVWKVTDNQQRGIIVAGRVGQVLGWIAIAFGLLPLLAGGFPNLWTALIGWFLLQNASAMTRSAIVQEKLLGLKAEEAIVPDSPIVPADMTLRQFANDYVIGQKQWKKFLVVDENGQLMGEIATADMKNVPTSDWISTQVKELMKPTDPERIIEAERSLLDVVKLLEESKSAQLPVVQDGGKLLGIVEKSSIMNLIQQREQQKKATA